MITLIYNPLAVTTPKGPAPLRGTDLGRVQTIADSHILVKDGRIHAFLAKDAPLPKRIDCFINATGKTVIPGLVDPHTHLVWGGGREEEFELRATGVPYEEIARLGGGILNTVGQTRQAGEDTLRRAARARLRRMMQNGTTTVEIKSGYGLTLADELKMLRVTDKLKQDSPVNIVSTFMPAHAVPPEYSSDRGAYIRHINEEMLPAVCEQGLADFYDVFCDSLAFSNQETEDMLLAARAAGLQLMLHADEIDDTGGTALAARLNVRGAAHLLRASDDSIAQLGSSETAAILLPGTSFYIKKPFARAGYMKEKNCILALSTDLNPGSSHLERMPMAMFLAIWGYGLTVNEVLTAATLNSAYALNMHQERGSLETGKRADLLILDCPNVKHLMYNYTANLVDVTMINGRCAYVRPGARGMCQ